MPTDLITFKADSEFIKKVDKAAKAQGYHSRTEFIREALRNKIESAELYKLQEYYANLRKKHNLKPITEAEYEHIREEAGKQIMQMSEEDQQKELEGLKRELHRRAKEKNKE